MPLPFARLALTTFVLLLVLAGCGGDSGPSDPPPDDPLFQRYVAFGGAGAAGFQSAGIADHTQLAAYPVLLAAMAGATFDLPLLADPGCPEPLAAPLAAPNATGACSLQETPAASRGQSVAVPGTRTADALALPAGPASEVQATMLGQRTQLEVAQVVEPTFVTVHLGDEDVIDAVVGGVLGSAAGGGDSVLTRLAAFVTGYTQLTTVLEGLAGLDGAVLIGVTDPVVATPALQPGAFFFLARDAATGEFEGKPVNSNCSPVTALGAPNPLSGNLVSFDLLRDGAFPEINCDAAALPSESPYLLTAAERAVISDRVAEMNEAIAAAADRIGWVYLDPNALLAPYLAEQDGNGRYQQIRKCQLLPAAATALEFQTAVLNSCPISPATSASAAPNQFGALFSFDGVHPSNLLHQALATGLAVMIDIEYGTTLGTSQ